jgi:hypothetical protein
MFVEGEFVDPVIGIPGSRSHIVMLRPPEGGPGQELWSFVWPDHEPGRPPPWPTNWGCQHDPEGGGAPKTDRFAGSCRTRPSGAQRACLTRAPAAGGGRGPPNPLVRGR